MENALFSFAHSNMNGIEGDNDPLDNPLERHEKGGVMVKGRHEHLFVIEDWAEIESLFSEYGFYHNNMAVDDHQQSAVCFSQDQQQQQQLPQQQHISDYCEFDDLQFSSVSSPIIQPLIQESGELQNIQAGLSDVVVEEPEKEISPAIPSLGLLSNYGTGLKKLKAGELSNLSIDDQQTNNMDIDRKLSTEEIVRVAGARFIEFSTQKDVDFNRLMHPFGYALSDLSEDETDDIELAHNLLAAAEKVGNQQFDRASKLLSRCEWIASDTGNPVQRVVFYFAKALRERIKRETGRISAKELEEINEGRYDRTGSGLSCNLSSLACYQKLPFTQVTQFTGIQAILENIESASKVHLIDLRIRDGVQWTLLMQALTERNNECPIELLKITAVGTTENKQKIIDTGKRLESFAESMQLNFSFKEVFVATLEDLKEELFKIETDEVVAVYSPLILKTMISRPNCLETLMRVLKTLNPTIMVVTEVEANLNSPSFVARFIEGLFFCSAFFDCLEDCMDRKNQTRMMTEALLGEGIGNITSTEGEERYTRVVNIDVWRAFFARFGMVEMEFSRPSLYQGSLLVEQFACGRSCTVAKNGKCIIVGWKGTPIHSLSAWKFYCERES